MEDMRKTAILVILLMFIPFVFAEEIEVDYPSKISLNEEFTFKIKLIDFDEDVYDAKIDILANGERVAQIWNEEENKWQSTYFYVKDSIENQEGEFKIKAIVEFGVADIEVKTMDSAGSKRTFSGYEIESLGGDSGEDSEDEENDSEDSEDEEDETSEEDDENDSNLEVDETENQKDIPENVQNNNTLNKITLNPKDINSETDKGILGNDYALYGLGIFSILIIILFTFKFLKNRKNEFR